jgi:potassium-transporting ATPase KdpC subunit
MDAPWGIGKKENHMRAQIKPAIIVLALLTLITGVIYPLVVTVIAQVAFPAQANGSLIVKDGQAIGSHLIGQPFDDPKYFWGRISATGTFPYNSFNAKNLTASSGSNYGPLNPALLQMVQARIDALKAADPSNPQPIPVDLVTSSGSGLDPHISPAAAEYQVARVARVRGLDESAVQQLVAQFTQGRDLGVLGEPRVNVLELNLALDAVASK